MKDLIFVVLFFGGIIAAYEGFIRLAWYMLCKAIEQGKIKEDIFAHLGQFNQLPPM